VATIRALAVLLAVACSLPAIDVASARGLRAMTIEVGAVINLDPQGDPDTQVALQLAVQDINAFFAAGDSPYRVRLTVEGTGLDPQVALAKVEKLAAQGVKVIVGPETSAEAATIKPFTDAHGVVAISHCSTAASLAIPNDSIYRMVASDERQAAVLAGLIRSAGHRAVVPMWRADIFGDDNAAALNREFTALGGTVLPGVRYDPDATDHSADLAALAAQVTNARATFDGAVAVILFAFGQDGATILARAADVPVLGTVIWYGSDGTAISREILDSPAAAGFAVKTGFLNTLLADVHTPKADAVRARISAGIGGGSVYFCAPAAYDAVWLAALSAATVSPSDTGAFVRALVAIAGSYEGASGPTTLDAAGDRVFGTYDLWAIENQDGEFVWKTVPQ
jgi:branched-chain amino acid transport system substrate-binding protein